MNENFAQQLRTRRTLLGITQEDLCEISGVSLRTIKSLESGRGNPTIRVLEKLLDVLGLKLATVEKIANG